MDKIDQLPMNHTLRYLYSHGHLPTVENYLRLNYFGDVKTLKGLEEMPEDYAEVTGLIEDGYLVNTMSVRVN